MYTIEQILARFKRKRNVVVREVGRPDYHVPEVHDSHTDTWIPISVLLTEHEDFNGHTHESFAEIPDVHFDGGASGGGGAERSFDSPVSDSIDSGSFDSGGSDCGGGDSCCGGGD